MIHPGPDQLFCVQHTANIATGLWIESSPTYPTSRWVEVWSGNQGNRQRVCFSLQEFDDLVASYLKWRRNNDEHIPNR